MEKDLLIVQSKKYAPLSWLSRLGFTNIDKAGLTQAFLGKVYPVMLGLVNFAVSYFFGNYVDSGIINLTHIVVIAASAWFGGVAGGITTMVVTILGDYYIARYVTDRGADLYFIAKSSVLVLNSVLLSHLVTWTNRRTEIEKLRGQVRDYARTFLELNEEYRKAKEDIKARDEFMSIASHELKTPLTSMLLKVGSMLDSIRNESLAKFSIPALMKTMENAQRQIRTLNEMINDLMNLSLINTGRMNLVREKTDLSRVARLVKENFSEMMKQEKYTMKLTTHSAVIGNWDRSRIEQAVTNLISNAIKYGGGKPIEAEVRNGQGKGIFMIRDQGIGISTEDQKKLFKRFSRAVTSAEYKKGLGVGLYITYQIAKAHGGDILVQSTPGKGTTFIMELPLNSK